MLMPKFSFGFLTILAIIFLDRTALPEQIHVFQIEQDSAKLEYRVSLLKDSFLTQELVISQAVLKNISKVSAQVYPPGMELWTIKDQNDRTYKRSWSYYALKLRLDPGDSLWCQLHLSTIYTRISTDDSLSSYGSFSPGVYRAYYYRDTIPFIFHVIEPRGEELEALNIFRASRSKYKDVPYTSLPETTKFNSRIKAVELLLSLVDQFPTSAYAFQALDLAADETWAHDHEQSYQIIQRSLRRFPHLGLNQLDKIKYYFQEKADFSGYQNELKNIIKWNANLKLTAAAKEKLKHIQEDFY